MSKGIVAVILAVSLLFTLAAPAHAQESISKNVNVSASITSFGRFTLFGYTSPKAIVTIEGLGVIAQTIADKDGYFEFVNEFTPLTKTETCLTSQDIVGRLTTPVCLAPFPVNHDTTIGPVIMSPSISLNNGIVYIGERVILTGKTIPNHTVRFSFFKDTQKSLFTNLVQKITDSIPFLKNVQAFSFPSLESKSDADGNFSIELPTENQSFLRLFTQVQYLNSDSQKSLTLHVNVLPWWMVIFTFLSAIVAFILQHMFEILLCLEVGILWLLLKRFVFHPFYLAQNRSIILYDSKELMIPNDFLMIPEEHSLLKK